MTVVITRKSCSFNEANAFYRVESYNASWRPATTTTAVALNASAGRVIPLTFANGWVFKWIVLSIYWTDTVANDRSILLHLQQNRWACTMPVASPWVVTFNSHWYTGWEEVFFSTSWVLPTGVVAGTRYFVKYKDANTFNISATSGGTNINFTGTSTGTHYLRTTVSSKTATRLEYTSDFWTSTSVWLWYRHQYLNDVNFTGFGTDITVDTTANKWRIVAFSTGWTSWTPQLWYGTNVWTYPHFAYCNTQVSLNDTDILIVAHPCNIDKSFTTGCVLWTSETTYGFAWLVCFNPTATSKDDVWYLTCNSPAAPYTWTLKWTIVTNGRAGVNLGSLTSRIPAANQLKIVFDTPLLWTSTPWFKWFFGKTSTTYFLTGRSNNRILWEYPTTIGTYLAADAELLQNKITVTWDITWWAINDTISIGRQNVIGLWEYKKYIIQSISWQEITLTTNITTGKRFATGMVINLTQSKFWVVLQNNNTTGAGFICMNPNALVLDWVFSLGIGYLSSSAAGRYYWDDSDIFLDNGFRNMSVEWNSTTNYVFAWATSRIPRTNMDFTNWRGYRMQPNYPSSTSWVSNVNYKCGKLIFRNVNTMNSYAGYAGIAQERWDVDWFQNDNVRATHWFIMSWRSWSIFKNIRTNGCSTYGVYMNFNALNSSYRNISINQSTYGFWHASTAVSIGNSFDNITIWNIVDCTYDYLWQWYFDWVIKNSGWFITPAVWYENLNDSVPWTMFRFVNKEDVATQDVVWATYGNLTRCWTGLADTTVYWTDSYSLRFDTIGWELMFCYDSPTGNIQWQSKIISVQCNIASANYWAGTYVLPKLTAIYDDWTELSCIAAQVTGWQKLFIPLETTTGSPIVRICLTTETDAIGADTYVYFWHFDWGIPTIRNMDNWADALPILDIWFLTATAATVRDAVMNADLSLYNLAWSFAKAIKTIKSKAISILNLLYGR